MNLDTVYEIAIRLDEEALVSLFVGLQLTAEQVKNILSDMFWYRRTEYLVGKSLQQQPNVNWSNAESASEQGGIPRDEEDS